MLLGSSTKITGVAAAGGNKFETPTGKYGKLASSSRLLSSKSFTEGSNTAYVSTAATTPVGPVAITTPGSNQKAVHWLKARSVHSGAYTSRGSGAKTNGNIKSRPGVLVKQQPVTTNNKKDTNSTPGGGSGGGGGGGASRRSLQILNKITQHRIEKGKKKNI
jgi:hypothetical protein